MSKISADWSSPDWVAVRTGLERVGVSGDQMTLVLHRYAPGTESNPHRHVNEQFIYVLEGETEILVDSAAQHVSKGGVLHIAPNVLHGVKPVGDQAAVVLEVFCPARPEMLRPS